MRFLGIRSTAIVPIKTVKKSTKVSFTTKSGKRVSFHATETSKKHSRSNSPKPLESANIRRAKEQYDALSQAQKRKIKNARSYVFKIAWALQRGRPSNPGHHPWEEL